jgi:hypothetical protein
VHVAFEEGHQAQWLHDLLKPNVHRVVVCDRRGEKRQGNEGDSKDADRIAQDLLRGALRGVYHGSGHRAALKELARTYENAVEDTTRTMLRLKALFRARAIRTPRHGGGGHLTFDCSFEPSVDTRMRGRVSSLAFARPQSAEPLA